MTHRFPGPSYIERLVPIPHGTAAIALDLALLDVGAGSSGPAGHWIHDTGSGRLVIAAPSERTAVGSLSGVTPLRHTHGTIRAGGFRFAVELELYPWSESASAIGLRPLGSRPRSFGSETYYRVGGAGLEHLRDEMLRWARADATARQRVTTRA